jgi:hypothetical protein
LLIPSPLQNLFTLQAFYPKCFTNTNHYRISSDQELSRTLLARVKKPKDNSTTSAPASQIVLLALLEVPSLVLRVIVTHNSGHRSNMILARRNSVVLRPISRSRILKW